MLLYRTADGPVVAEAGEARRVPIDDWDVLVNHHDLSSVLSSALTRGEPARLPELPLAPIERQELWAAGVTYERSRSARMEESEKTGGADFYDRVYVAERP